MKEIKELRTDFIDDNNLQHVDAWFDNDENSEGKTIAVVCRDTKKVIYFDNYYRAVSKVGAVILEILADIDAEKNEIVEAIIKRANELGEQGACMGNGWDADTPMTELAEAITFMLIEDEVLGEIDGAELYDTLTKKI